MTKREIKGIEKVKQEYILNLKSANEVFNLPSHEYDRLDESTKWLADRHYGYAEGIYQTLVLLGQADDIPKFEY